MKVIKPIDITTAMLTSNVPETDYAEWVSGTTYSSGQRVIRATVHKIYEALKSTTGKTPEDNPEDWLDLGATNRWKMFDQKAGSVTARTANITVEIEAGQVVQSVALLGLAASSVTVTVTDDTDGEVYSNTQDLPPIIEASDWFHYFFDQQRNKTVAYFDGLPSYRSASVDGYFDCGAAETVECGTCIVGDWYAFADAVRYGASMGIRDYSKKEADEFGNYYIVERKFSKTASWQFMITKEKVDLFMDVMSSLRAKPTIYIGGTNYDSVSVYGIPIDFDVLIEYPKFSMCSIELEGLS